MSDGQRIEPRGKNLAALSTEQLLIEYRRAPRIPAGMSGNAIKELDRLLEEARRRDIYLDGLRSAYAELRARITELQSLVDAYAQRVTDQDTEIAVLRQREEMR